MSGSTAALPLLRKLRSTFELTEAEERSILALPAQIRDMKRDQDIVREGDRPSQCCVVLAGLVCRYRVVVGGRRQILSFAIPGDMPDLHSVHLATMDHNIGTLTVSTVALIPHAHVSALIAAQPRIAAAFWRDTLIDAAVFREWMVGLGRRLAHTRIAHLICELVVRLTAVGLSDGLRISLPVSQEVIGDALGVTVVHVNRILQALRKEGLITWSDGILEVKDWPGLVRAGDFDPTYLHLREVPKLDVAPLWRTPVN
jgi:CRP-like cAMP-binding protein